MHPVQPALDPQPGLVEMRPPAAPQRLPDEAEEVPLQPPRHPAGHGRHAALADRHSEQIRHRGGDPFLRPALGHQQVDHDRGQPRPVLDRDCHLGRSRPRRASPATAVAGHQLMLGHRGAHRRHLEDLPTRQPYLGRPGQVPPTVRTCPGLVPHHHIRVVHLPQRLTLVSRLPTGLAPRPTPQRPRRRLGQPLRGWRPIRVTRVLPQPPLQLGDPLLRRRQLNLHLCQLRL